MSVIDGGSFKCYETEDKTMHYETVDPKAWEEHKKEHCTESGSAACTVCGKQTHFQHLKFGKKPLCEDCKKELTS